MGLFLLSLGLVMIEMLLNYTGHIVSILWISNFSEPINFILAPLLYLFIRERIDHNKGKYDWVHFLPFVFWLLYCIPYFMQSDIFKYNSYIDTMKPDWPFVEAEMYWHEDILNLRNNINYLTLISFSSYLLASLILIAGKAKQKGSTFFKIEDPNIRATRNSTYHLFFIIVIFVFVKLYFGRDLGDYFIGLYITFMAYNTMVQVIRNSNYFDQPGSIFDIPTAKYKKSSLLEDQKELLLNKVKIELCENKYFANNMASVSGLAKNIGESSHHVSQVINEKMNKSFFELLAWYRVEEAKRILTEDIHKKYTIEELADEVGYNSKSSFNGAFKKLSGQTPSEFRKNNGID